jgi:uncharacterized repeat protein (TIGR01451 family)
MKSPTPGIAIRHFFILACASCAIISGIQCGSSDNPVAPKTKPVISTQPVSHSAFMGSSAAFTVVATGDSVLTYQWKKNGVACTGVEATTDSFVIASVAAPDTGTYTVTVTNSGGSVTSAGAKLTIPLLLTLVSPTGGETFSVNDSVTLHWLAVIDSTRSFPDVHSFTFQFSLDSGATWEDMTKDMASFLSPQDGIYSVKWIVLDTTAFNTLSGTFFTVGDFLNKGVLTRISSYQPHAVTIQSGYILFHP